MANSHRTPDTTRQSCLCRVGHDSAVVSCRRRCELTAGQVRSATECVQRSHCAARHTPTQTGHRTHLSGCRADSVHTATPDTTKQSCLCRVGHDSVNWTIAINVFRLKIFCRRQCSVVENPVHTPKATLRVHRRQCRRVWRGGVNN